jgi:hypothetical protein
MKDTSFLTQYCNNMCMDDRNLFLTLVGHKGQVNIFFRTLVFVMLS